MKTNFYLIVSADNLATAYYCGSPKEISRILEIDKKSFYNMVKYQHVNRKYKCRVELVKMTDDIDIRSIQ